MALTIVTAASTALAQPAREPLAVFAPGSMAPRFADFVPGPKGQGILRSHGFSAP